MKKETTKLVELAIGRILLLGSRPTQPGDVEEYERCRKIIMDHAPTEETKETEEEEK